MNAMLTYTRTLVILRSKSHIAFTTIATGVVQALAIVAQMGALSTLIQI